MTSKALLVHPGTQHAPRLARTLIELDALTAFWTGVAFDRDALSTRALRAALPGRIVERIANRIYAGIPNRYLHAIPSLELGAMLAIRRGKPPLEAYLDRNRRFQERIPARAFAEADTVIGFDTSSWILARRCRDLGKPFILDQSIAHPLEKKRVFEEVAARFPEWREDLEPPLPAMLEHEAEEHRLASRIIVASAFTKRSLTAHDVPEEKIVTLPYGVDLAAFAPAERPRGDRPFRFLFIGSITARKGVPLLLEAWRKLKPANAELVFAGPISPRVQPLLPNLPGVTFLGKKPHSELPALVRESDVLVFPSYFEGFGLVVLEAMAGGLPVIASDATVGSDVITDGEDGFLMRAGDDDGLCRALETALTEADKIRDMGRAARRTAERYTWPRYAEGWRGLLTKPA